MKRVLVADDDEATRVIFSLVLRHHGYEVIEARDGEEATRFALADPPDLILLDFIMPGKNGLEVCSELRRDLRTKHLPILLITADHSSEIRDLATESCVTACLTKPTPLSVLMTEVVRYVGLA